MEEESFPSHAHVWSVFCCFITQIKIKVVHNFTEICLGF